jgi:RNAse (barnase) inhibitor barstar
MNIGDFNVLAKEQLPTQNLPEWQYFLEFVEAYFKNRGISHPIVVELGVQHNYQKQFYEKFLGAEHIGIDIEEKVGKPDILGDTHDEETLNKLKAKLNGRAINLLFIDAEHFYDDVAMDYEMYGPLVQNIIALHDVVHDDPTLPLVLIRLLWEEILKNERDEDKHTKVLISLEHVRFGIGMVMKE